jgi:transcriptional regulator with XRE-family HTH domain
VPKSEFDRLVGSRLQRAREKAGWTQEALAFRVEIDPTTLSRYETGRLPVPLEVLSKAATVLGVRLAHLVDFERELPKRMAEPATVPKRPPASERRALEEVWAELRPHDRSVLLDLARVLSAKRRPKTKKARRK